MQATSSAVYLHGLLHSFKRFNCSFRRVDEQVVRSSFNMGRVKFLSLGYVYSDICRLVLLSQKSFGLCASPHTMVDGYELQLEWERHRLLDFKKWASPRFSQSQLLSRKKSLFHISRLL
jgi:hypothetical protein